MKNSSMNLPFNVKIPNLIEICANRRPFIGQRYLRILCVKGFYLKWLVVSQLFLKTLYVKKLCVNWLPFSRWNLMALSVGSCFSSMYHPTDFTEAFAISKKAPLTSSGNTYIGTVLKAPFHKENKDIMTLPSRGEPGWQRERIIPLCSVIKKCTNMLSWKTMKTPPAWRILEEETGTLTNAKLGTNSGKLFGETTADIGEK